jgi:hypothetical protein
VVTHITEGTAFDKRGLPFRRRNIRPGLIAAGVLAVITAVIWLIALSRPPDVQEAAVCNPPPQQTEPDAPTLGQQLSFSAMTYTAPARLADTKIRVLNASGHGGQAAEVSGALRDLGFAQPTAANDPIYANARLSCQGQIRFGEKGKAGAASLWLVAPCTELFQDDRPDDSVDLAIGTEFTALTHSDDIDAVLAGLRPDATEPADSALIAKIHSASC